MNGESVPRLIEGFFQPLHRLLDVAFAAGVAYGVGGIASWSWRCWRGFRVFWLPFGRCTRGNLKERFGEWAVIVGATSGIGLAFTEELARRKMNIILISKSYDDLVQLVSKIQSEHSVQAYGIHADFSLGRHVYQEIDDALLGYEIGLLVNAVAVNYDHPQYFVLIPQERLTQILDVNITATTIMTYMLLPQMLERQRGAVINVCSQITTLPPSPLVGAYSASMAYIRRFSESLQLESRGRGIIVQTLLPGFVATPDSPPTFLTPSCGTYVSHALDTLGVATTTCGYWPHSIQSWLYSWVPQWLWVWLVFKLFKRQRFKRIAQAKEQGTQQFARRRHSSVVVMTTHPTPNQRTTPSGRPALRRVSGDLGLTLRRSPSPQRKFSGSLTATPLRHLDPVPTFAREETHHVPIRGSSAASIPSPIPESPFSSTPRFFPQGASNIPTDSSTPLSAPAQGGGNFSTPKRSLSSSSAPGSNSIHQRHHLPIRHSQVMVIPSVAHCTQQNTDTDSISSTPPQHPTTSTAEATPTVAETTPTVAGGTEPTASHEHHHEQ